MTSDLPTSAFICSVGSSLARLAWKGLGSTLTLGAVFLWGSIAFSPVGLGQTTLDANLEGQQSAPQVPPLPDMDGVIYVDATNGSDSSGNGSQSNPYRTITHAIEQASPRTVIQLLPGIYSEESGETFPITLKAGLVLRGDESSLGEGYLIVGGGTYISPTLARQNVTMLAETASGIRGVTMRNEGRRGYALWLESTAPNVYNNSFVGSIHDGIFLTGNAGGIIQGNRFYQNGANGISVLGTSTPQIRNNLFQETGFGITIDKQSAPRVENNRVVNNRSGVIVGGNARPILRGNLIKDNLDTGLVAITQGLPDLGTASDPGNNQFVGNGNLDINNSTKTGTPISANGNQISGQTKGDIDITGQVAVAELDTSAMPGEIAAGSIPDPVLTTNSGAAVASPSSGTSQTAATTPSPAVQAAAPTPTPPPTTPSPLPQASPSPQVQITPVPTPTPPQVQITPVPAPSPQTLPTVSVPSAANSSGSRTQPETSGTSAPNGQTLEFTAVPFTAESEASPSTPSSEPATAPAPAPSQEPLLDITTLKPVGGPSSPLPTTNPTDASPASDPPSLTAAQADTTEPSVASNEAAQFRVLVTPQAEQDLTRLREIVPEAIETSFNGRSVFQAGLYDSRSAAQAILDQLLDAGFDAVAEMIFIQ